MRGHYPDLHDSVTQRLEEADLHFDFHEADDPDTCIRTYGTNIMGKFTGHNKQCAAKGWSSKIVAVTIRMYAGQQYNARVYLQRCRSCQRSSTPVLDGSYAERIAYRLKKWSEKQVEPPEYSEGKNRGPHQSGLCEGCKAGHCKYSN